MEIPDVARPTEVHAEGVVDLMKVVVRLLLNLVATGPHPRYLAPFDKFEGTRKVVRVVIGVLWVNDVACQHDQIWAFSVQNRLDKTLRLEIVFRVVTKLQITKCNDLKAAIWSEL